jgi:hypothetical protein
MLETQPVSLQHYEVNYQIHNPDALSLLERMRDRLRDIQKSHRQVFKTAIRKLNVAIEQTRKSMDRDSEGDYQPISENKHPTPENMDDVRRLFGSLV